MTTDWTSPPEAQRRASRRKVWGTLAVLLAIAVGLLLLAVSSRDEEPPTAAEGIRFRVVDEHGEPVHHAEVFILAGEGLPEGGAGRWTREDATLTLPAAVRGSAIAVQATGYRSDVAREVTGDMDFVLRHGFVVRLEARGSDAEATGDTEYVLVFQVIPAAREDFTDDQRWKVADLITTLVPAPEGTVLLPAGEFGFAVQAAVAEHGLLMPLAGRYEVRWGLLAPDAGLWYTPPDDVLAVIDVTDDPRTQLFPIPVAPDALQQARRGLADKVREVQAGR